MSTRDMKVLVTGAGGFIGGHMVGHLQKKYDVVAVDIRPIREWDQRHWGVDNIRADMSIRENCFDLMDGIDQVYNLACDMGGIAFIEANRATCMMSVLINTHLLQAAIDRDVDRFFYASSACIYSTLKQGETDSTALVESDAYPAMCEDGYGWEKLFSERLCKNFQTDYGLDTRVARFHNVYGPNGTYKGGREKAPAAICRKVIEAKLSGDHQIDIWGDGKQTRSFMWVGDCVEGVEKIMRSEIEDPINLGSSELVTINELVDIAEDLAGIKLTRNYDLSAPQGVRGRNSDNTMILDRLGWEPSTPLREGLEKTYQWIFDQITQ